MKYICELIQGHSKSLRPSSVEDQHTVLSSQKQWQDKIMAQGNYLLFQFTVVYIDTSSLCGLSWAEHKFDFPNTDHAHGDKIPRYYDVGPPSLKKTWENAGQRQNPLIWVHPS